MEKEAEDEVFYYFLTILKAFFLIQGSILSQASPVNSSAQGQAR
jgi:hypothetical protein